jgi:hypothetical protein
MDRIGPSMSVGTNPTAQGARAAAPPSAARPSSTPTPTPSFREVFDAHSAFVWRALLGLGVREPDVADASQQVFVVLHG